MEVLYEKNKSFAFSLQHHVSDFGSGVAQYENIPTVIEDINKSTERYKRTQLRCRIATEPNLKHFPKGWTTSKPIRNEHLCRLFGDGSIEFITGANDSTYIKELQNFPNEGNEARATKPINHPIYSPQPDFELGLDLNFHNAHFFTVDVNGDDKDDVVFAQQGRDWAPFQKMSNMCFCHQRMPINSSVCPDENPPIITEQLVTSTTMEIQT